MLYGCESCELKDGCILRVFENRILGRMFQPKRDANGEWSGLNEEFHSLYHLPNIVMVIKYLVE